MSITSKHYGRSPEGKDAVLYTLINKNGLKTEITNYGGIIASLFVPDKNGLLTDITLGFDTFEEYLSKHPYFGSIVGRHANRIEAAQFELNGVKYELYKNNGNNHLHGGKKGFDKVLWDSEVITVNGVEKLQLSYFSIDGEEGYPGNLEVTVLYTLNDRDELVIEYLAKTDKDTVVNLTNHAYFNLSGHSSGSIENHKVMVNADSFTVINAEGVPTGEIRKVDGTPMDLRKPVVIAHAFSSGYEQITTGGGFDHNWILNASGDLAVLSAEVADEVSGRKMEVYTDKPGVQLYTGNFLDGSIIGKNGAVYGKRAGLCLETQYFPNALKHKHFPSPILKAGQKYQFTTVYKFGTI